jgi:ATP-dependent Lon protease
MNNNTEQKIIKETQNNDTKEIIPNILPIIPLRDIVIFPYMMYPVLVGRESTVKAINTSLEKEKYIMLVAQVDSRRPGA